MADDFGRETLASMQRFHAPIIADHCKSDNILSWTLNTWGFVLLLRSLVIVSFQDHSLISR